MALVPPFVVVQIYEDEKIESTFFCRRDAEFCASEVFHAKSRRREDVFEARVARW